MNHVGKILFHIFIIIICCSSYSQYPSKTFGFEYSRSSTKKPFQIPKQFPRKVLTQAHSLNLDTLDPTSTSTDAESYNIQNLRKKLDGDFIKVAFPAFLGLVADPLASIVDAIYVGKLGPSSQAGMGIAISAQYSVAKLYNDPLIKTSTSLVAGKSGQDLSASVSTAILTAIIIGTMQFFLFMFLTGPLMTLMGVSVASDMRKPAVDYLRWRAAGVPAATVVMVSNGIFRGRGDTR